MEQKKQKQKKHLGDDCLWTVIVILFGNPNLTLKGILSLTRAVISLYEGRSTNNIAWFVFAYHYI